MPEFSLEIIFKSNKFDGQANIFYTQPIFLCKYVLLISLKDFSVLSLEAKYYTERHLV